MSSPVPKEPNARIVCAGQRLSARDTPYWCWYELDAEGLPVRERGGKEASLGFIGKDFREGVGMVFAASKSDDGVTWAKRSYEGTLDCPGAVELCAAWKAEEAAAKVAQRAASDLRKGRNADWIGELVAPLRVAYRKADTRGREVILATAIRKITEW